MFAPRFGSSRIVLFWDLLFCVIKTPFLSTFFHTKSNHQYRHRQAKSWNRDALGSWWHRRLWEKCVYKHNSSLLWEKCVYKYSSPSELIRKIAKFTIDLSAYFDLTTWLCYVLWKCVIFAILRESVEHIKGAILRCTNFPKSLILQATCYVKTTKISNKINWKRVSCIFRLFLNIQLIYAIFCSRLYIGLYSRTRKNNIIKMIWRPVLLCDCIIKSLNFNHCLWFRLYVMRVVCSLVVVLTDDRIEQNMLTPNKDDDRRMHRYWDHSEFFHSFSKRNSV